MYLAQYWPDFTPGPITCNFHRKQLLGKHLQNGTSINRGELGGVIVNYTATSKCISFIKVLPFYRGGN